MALRPKARAPAGRWESGELAELCRRHGIRFVTVLGSIGRGEDNPRDLDVAVMIGQGNTRIAPAARGTAPMSYHGSFRGMTRIG